MDIELVDMTVCPNERISFVSLPLFGYDGFWMGKFAYRSAGVAAGYVVVFKVNGGASLTNKEVVTARRLT